MTEYPRNISTDLRGIGSLTVDAVTGITDMVELLHHTIISFAGMLGAPDQQRTNGITGMVYRNIRGVTRWVGSAVDSILGGLGAISGEESSSSGREAALSILNGVLGDHLVATNNPLAIPMTFRLRGKPLDNQALSKLLEEADGRLVIMVHGSCMNDLQWRRHGHDHGAALARDFGYIPVYVHYNTGLHISENGRAFSVLMERLIALSPKPTKLFIISHSMGGLVSRSACHYGKALGHSWPDRLQKIVFLGTPHHGAMLEKGGNRIDNLLAITPYSAPFSRLGKIRSAGITDLRYGNVVDEDWTGRDRFAPSGDLRMPVPLPEGVQCYSIAATTGDGSNKLSDNLVGDGLVTLASGLGRHRKPFHRLSFPDNHQWIGRNMNHMDLLSHPDVYATIVKWMQD